MPRFWPLQCKCKSCQGSFSYQKEIPPLHPCLLHLFLSHPHTVIWQRLPEWTCWPMRMKAYAEDNSKLTQKSGNYKAACPYSCMRNKRPFPKSLIFGILLIQPTPTNIETKMRMYFRKTKTTRFKAKEHKGGSKKNALANLLIILTLLRSWKVKMPL